MPLDIITGILFLLINFIENKEQKKEEEVTEETSQPSAPIHQRTVSRDRIINPKKPKEE
jgi:large-conductance mechanosensitive channel